MLMWVQFENKKTKMLPYSENYHSDNAFVTLKVKIIARVYSTAILK